MFIIVHHFLIVSSQCTGYPKRGGYWGRSSLYNPPLYLASSYLILHCHNVSLYTLMNECMTMCMLCCYRVQYVCDHDINFFIRHCNQHILMSTCLLSLLQFSINLKCHVISNKTIPVDNYVH